MSQNLFNPPKRVDVDLSPYAGQNAYAIGGASDAKPVVVYHDGKPMRCEGHYDDWYNEFGCRYETPISCDDCVFVVGPQTGDMRRGKRPFAKINWEVK